MELQGVLLTPEELRALFPADGNWDIPSWENTPWGKRARKVADKATSVQFTADKLVLAKLVAQAKAEGRREVIHELSALTDVMERLKPYFSDGLELYNKWQTLNKELEK